MKISAQILPFLLLLCGLVTAQEPNPPVRKAAAAVTRIIPRLEDCPAAVRTALKMNGHDTRISEIKLTEEEGQKTYSFETGTEEDGVDAEITYHYSGTGMLLKTEREIPLKEAPEKVQEALKKVAGPAAAVDDVEVVTAAGGTVYYRAELESNGGADRKVRVSPDGVILELIEEEDD